MYIGLHGKNFSHYNLGHSGDLLLSPYLRYIFDVLAERSLIVPSLLVAIMKRHRWTQNKDFDNYAYIPLPAWWTKMKSMAGNKYT